MSDVQQMVADPISNAVENARLAKQQVEAIDEQLDLADNASETVRKNSVARGFIAEYGEEMKEFEEKLIATFEQRYSTSDEMLVAAVTHAKNIITSNFNERVNNILADKIKDMPVQELTDAERKELESKRANFAKLYKYSKEIIEMLDKSRLPEELKTDLRIRRAGGSRGPSFVGTYRFYVETAPDSGEFDEKTITVKGQSKPAGLSLIANTVCQPLDWQTRDLKDYIIKQLNREDSITGVTSTSPGQVALPNTWDVKLPEPVNLRIKGVKVGETTAPDEEDEQDNNTATEADLA